MDIVSLLQSAIEVEQAWKGYLFRFCFIGGIAVQRWGQPRSTRDLDLTLLTGFAQEDEYIDCIEDELAPLAEEVVQLRSPTRGWP